MFKAGFNFGAQSSTVPIADSSISAAAAAAAAAAPGVGAASSGGAAAPGVGAVPSFGAGPEDPLAHKPLGPGGLTNAQLLDMDGLFVGPWKPQYGKQLGKQEWQPQNGVATCLSEVVDWKNVPP